VEAPLEYIKQTTKWKIINVKISNVIKLLKVQKNFIVLYHAEVITQINIYVIIQKCVKHLKIKKIKD